MDLLQAPECEHVPLYETIGVPPDRVRATASSLRTRAIVLPRPGVRVAATVRASRGSRADARARVAPSEEDA